jgi:hypothetical protein
MRLVVVTAALGLLAGLLPLGALQAPAAAVTATATAPRAIDDPPRWPVLNVSSRIVQRVGPFTAWAGLEAESIAWLKELHQLRADDPRVVAFGRDEARAAIFTRLIGIAQTPVADRTAADQAALDVLVDLVQAEYVEVAQAARGVYTTWSNNPCSWAVDAPDPLPQDASYLNALATWCASSIAQQTTGPPSPPIEAFQTIAAWRIYQPVFSSPEFAETVPSVAVALGLVGGAVTAGLAGSVAAAIAGPSAVALAIAMGSKAASVAGAGGAAAVGTLAFGVGALIFCIVGSVLQGIQVVNDADIPNKLDQAITDARDKRPDLAADLLDDTKGPAILGVFLAQTLPEYPEADAYSALPQSPFDPAVDPILAVTPVGGTRVNTGIVGLDTWSLQANGKPGVVTRQQVFVHDGWFILQAPNGGPLRTTLRLRYVDGDGALKVAFLRGNGFVTTEVDADGVVKRPASPQDAVVDQLSVRAHLDDGAGALKSTLLIPRPVIDGVSVPTGLVEGVPFTVQASARDLGGSSVRYSWRVTLPCRPFVICDSTRTPPSYDEFFSGPSPVMSIHVAGTHRTVLTVLNDVGAAARLETTITVAKAVPSLGGLTKTLDADGRTVSLSGEVVHTGPGQQVTVRVRWGDGELSSLTFPRATPGVIVLDYVAIGRQRFEFMHTYPVGPGRYNVDVSAEASNGMSALTTLLVPTTARTITVQAPSATVVVGEPLGSLVPTLDGIPNGADPAAVQAGSCSTTRQPDSLPGSYPVTCSGATGPANYVFAYLDGAITVAPAVSTTSVALTAGAATATVTPVAPGAGTPTGRVTFSVNGASIGSADLDGSGAAAVPLPPGGGPLTVAAAYDGDDRFLPSAASTARSDPQLLAQPAGEPNAAGWFASSPSIAFTCTPGSAPLAVPCPTPVQLGEGAGQSITRSIQATDGGVATVSVAGLNVDLTPPTVRVTGVRDGDALLAPLAVPPTCEASDGLSGLDGACTVTTARTRAATAPRYRATWEYVARASDRAGNATAVRGEYTVSAVRLLGAQPGARGGLRIRSGIPVPVILDLPLRRAPRLLGVVPAGRPFRAVDTEAVRLVRRADGTWITSVRVSTAQAQRTRFWKLGIALPGRREPLVVTLDVGRRG